MEQSQLAFVAETEKLANRLPEGDYILTDGCAWFTVGKFSVRIILEDDGVECSIYPDGHEMMEPLGVASALNEEVEELLCRTCGGENVDGEGYDGECGDCADKKEASNGNAD